MMNAEEFARSVQRRLGMKRDTDSALYSFLLAVRTQMQRGAGRWQATYTRAQETAARARREEWSAAGVAFYDQQVTRWRLYLELAARLEALTPDNAEERMADVLLLRRADVGVLGYDVQAALNVCHLYDTPSGQYEDWRSLPVPAIRDRFAQSDEVAT